VASINLEDLSQTNTVLRLLNSRGRHSPAVFAGVDLESVRTGLQSDAIHRKGGFAVFEMYMDLESHSLEQYGQITKYEPSAEKAEQGLLPNVSSGLLVLQIQDRILDFLVKLCIQLLHDDNLGDALKGAPVLPEPPDLTVQDGEWLSIVDLALETPYLVPQKVNLRHLRSLAEARLDECKNYAWDMKEDPAYSVNIY
jgi:hypothetical protein